MSDRWQRQTRTVSLCFLFASLGVRLGGRDHVQHRPPRLATSGQGALGEHLGGTDDIQPPTGGNQVTLWQRRRAGLGASPQRPGLLRGGKPRRAHRCYGAADAQLWRPLARESERLMLTAEADSTQITSIQNYGKNINSSFWVFQHTETDCNIIVYSAYVYSGCVILNKHKLEETLWFLEI